MMRSDKRIKLMLSNKNVRNFPKDFFEDTPLFVHKTKGVVPSSNWSIDVSEHSRILQPLKLFEKTRRIASPSIPKREREATSRMNASQFWPSIFNVKMSPQASFRIRHQKVKSLSFRSNKNSDSVWRALANDGNQLKLKETFTRHINFKRMVKDSSKSISTAVTIPESQNSNHETNFGKTKRSKSIQKKCLLHRRNLQQILNTRQKITYSAHPSSMQINENIGINENISLKSPHFSLSDRKLKNYGYLSVEKCKNRPFVKPFLLSPIDTQEKINFSNTRNLKKWNEDFSFPKIFSKDSPLLYESDSQASIFDIEWDNSTTASPTLSPSKRLSPENESQFLLKLEKTLVKSYDQSKEEDIGMSTAYFGAKNK